MSSTPQSRSSARSRPAGRGRRPAGPGRGGSRSRRASTGPRSRARARPCVPPPRDPGPRRCTRPWRNGCARIRAPSTRSRTPRPRTRGCSAGRAAPSACRPTLRAAPGVSPEAPRATGVSEDRRPRRAASRSAPRRRARARSSRAEAEPAAARSPPARVPTTPRARQARQTRASAASRAPLAARRRFTEPRLHGRRPIARPVPQRRVGAFRGDGLVRGERGLQLAELLASEPEAGERAIAIGGLDVLDRRDRLERLRRVLESIELELRFARQQKRLGANRVVAARAGRLGLGRGVLPVLLLERRAGELEGGLVRKGMVGELLAEAPPRGLLVLGLTQPPRDQTRVVEALGGRRRLLHQLGVGALLLRLVAGLGEGPGDRLARRRGHRMRWVRRDERLEVLHASIALAGGDARRPEQILGIGHLTTLRILGRVAREQRYGLGRALEIDERLSEVERRRPRL